MKVSAIIFGGLLSVFVSSAAPAGGGGGDFLIRDGDRVVIYGDSITAGEWYPALIESYLLTRYPQWQHDVRVRGVGGDRLSNLERFRRDAVASRPDVLTVMMGYNDAGFQRLCDAPIQQFLQSVREAVGLIRQSNPEVRLLLASDPINELAMSDDPDWISRRFYPYTLLTYSRAERALAKKMGVPFVNMAEEYGRIMALGHAIAPGSFGLSRDGVHPQQEGQFFIAALFLEAMGANPQRSEVVIDVERGRVGRAEGAAVSHLSVGGDGIIAWSYLAESLPFPVPESIRAFSFLIEPEERLCRERLVVKGLSAAAYQLEIDGERIGRLSAAELAEGVSLSRWYDSPMMRQSMDVLAAAKRRQEAENALWSAFIAPGKADNEGLPLKAMEPQELRSLTALRENWEEATKNSRCVNQPRSHRFRLIPLSGAVSDHEQALGHDLAQAFLEVRAEPLALPMPESAEAVIHLENPGNSLKEGEVRWLPEAGWRLPETVVPFRLEPGASKTMRLALSQNTDGGTGVVGPQYQVTWRWSAQWPYPMSVTRRLPLQPQLVIPRFSLMPGFTGNSEEWSRAAQVILDEAAATNRRVAGKQRLWGGALDLSARLYLAWSEKGLLVAAKVHDDVHTSPSTLNWNGDLLHLFAVVRGDGGQEMRYQFGVGLPAGGTAECLMLPPQNTSPRYHVTRDESACITFYELLLPWECLRPFQAIAGGQLRLNVAINDDDGGSGKGFTSLEWTAGINYGNAPELFPIITLGP